MGYLNILSRTNTPFHDRQEAARLLGEQLENQDTRDENPLIIGIPNPGILTARGIGETLQVLIDTFLIRTLQTPTNITYGTVTETNILNIDAPLVTDLDITTQEIQRERTRQLRELAECATNFRRVRPRANPHGRYIILTDQGADDITLLSDTVQALAKEKPRSINIALPIAPEHTLRHLASLVDNVLCLQSPLNFTKISDYYENFPDVSDREVVTILQDEFERISGHRIQPQTTPSDCTYNPREIPI
jgi:putative phosphoribosyl transferase